MLLEQLMQGLHHKTGLWGDKKTQEGHDTATKWMNKYLASNENMLEGNLEYNRNYPQSLDELTYSFMEGERLEIFLGAFGLWLSANKFRTRQNTWLDVTCKEAYFKAAKEVLKTKFPQHHLFQAGQSSEWFTDLRIKFFKRVQAYKDGRSRGVGGEEI
mmetsp:Transcript_28955/g.61177  ORF Transcript_28955/g.61177 Transcript_28955/m.61177 type:complete len:158 (+) Transcript_28955:468-941(+)